MRPSLDRIGDTKSYVEILNSDNSSSRTQPTIAKASILTKLIGLTSNHISSIQDDDVVILKDISGMGADISPMQILLQSLFELVSSYEAQSTFVDKVVAIEESRPYLKAKDHIELVLRERDEKFKEVFTSCKSLEKARKKVKKLKAHRYAAKQEVEEVESKVLDAEEEFFNCSVIFLATIDDSNVVEKNKQVLKDALQDLVNYILCLD
ncbi:hypothetical protein FXO38_26251 [Capsicum annuum]|uniref:Uncharacterized protein n=1 Tax=Capsicum annuum TaxID=4072 RepID=A0A2G2YRH0_CAPAN|nr:hypothetical protein FXO38_26251 [Capsicum annuum]KAF3684617.1 hypothetical protein FXO37_01260 [Capsicum annuum]PHT72340.1 hypothetical protein T459_23125 [Capsicum annuum]